MVAGSPYALSFSLSFPYRSKRAYFRFAKTGPKKKQNPCFGSPRAEVTQSKKIGAFSLFRCYAKRKEGCVLAAITIKGIPENTLATIRDLSKDAKMTQNKYLIALLNNHAISPEVGRVESNYQELLQLVIHELQYSRQTIEALMKMLGEDA